MALPHLGNDGRGKGPVFTRVITGVMGSFFSWDCRRCSFFVGLKMSEGNKHVKYVSDVESKQQPFPSLNFGSHGFPNYGLVIPFSLSGSFTKGYAILH